MYPTVTKLVNILLVLEHQKFILAIEKRKRTYFSSSTKKCSCFRFLVKSLAKKFSLCRNVFTDSQPSFWFFLLSSCLYSIRQFSLSLLLDQKLQYFYVTPDFKNSRTLQSLFLANVSKCFQLLTTYSRVTSTSSSLHPFKPPTSNSGKIDLFRKQKTYLYSRIVWIRRKMGWTVLSRYICNFSNLKKIKFQRNF